MALENYTGKIADMVVTNPTPTDPKSQGDDHLRGIKYTLQQTFPNFDGPLNAARVPFAPAGTIAANNVQAAIQELDTEKVSKSGDTMTGSLRLNTAAVTGLIPVNVERSGSEWEMFRGYNNSANQGALIELGAASVRWSFGRVGGSDDFVFRTNGTEKFRIGWNSGKITAGGGFAIINPSGIVSTITSSGSDVPLRLSKTGGDWECLDLEGPSGAAVFASIGRVGAKWTIGQNNSDPNFLFRTNGGQKAYIDWNTGAYTATSDRRAKENIVPADPALSKVLSVEVVSYRLKNAPDAGTQVGMIAQDLLPIIPEVVGGDPDSEQLMGINYAGLTPFLVKAVQELSAKLDAAVAEIAALKAAK